MYKPHVEDRLSYSRGPSDAPLLHLTIGSALDQAALRWGESTALVDCGRSVRLTWRELRDRATKLAAALLSLDLVPGQRVGIWALNRFEWTLAQMALAKAGLVLVTLNPAYRIAELQFALAKSGCSALITAVTFKSSDYVGMLNQIVPELATAEIGSLSSHALPDLRHVITMGPVPVPGAIRFSDLEDRGAREDVAAVDMAGRSITPDAAVAIQFTSGTTGTPKGVTLTHRNILNNGYFLSLGLQLTQEDRICAPVPLFHCFGMVMTNLAALTSGAAMVYPAEGFDPLATLQAIASERCTTLYGVPTMFMSQLNHPEFERFDLSSLRTGIMAGSPCPTELMKQVMVRMHLAQITICYGMTETSPVSTQTSPDDPIELRVETVGRVMPHLEIKIVDVDGTLVEHGVPGELCTRGYSVMAGYWDEPEQTSDVRDIDGWMHSGDLCTMDSSGYVRVVGRIKDMVIRGGENLYPREIEEFLHRLPGVRDVAVFGIPDERYGEELCAWIVAHDGHAIDPQDVRTFCQGQISHQKIPRHIRIVLELPATASGKPQKFLMRESMIIELAG